MKTLLTAFLSVLLIASIAFATPTIYEVEKQPYENYLVVFEYAGKLPIGGTLVSGVISAWNLTDNTDATSAIINSTSAVIVGTQSRMEIKAGTSGKRYQVTCKVTLSNGYHIEDEFYLYVREI